MQLSSNGNFSVGQLTPFDMASPLTIPKGTTPPTQPNDFLPFNYYQVTPLMSDWVLLGEVNDKMIPTSAMRISEVVVFQGRGMMVSVKGTPGEKITIQVAN